MPTLGSTIGTIHPEVFGSKLAYTRIDLAEIVLVLDRLRRTGRLSPWDQHYLEVAEDILVNAIERKPGSCWSEMSDLLECIHAKKEREGKESLEPPTR